MSIKKHLFSILIFIVYTSIFAQDSTPSFAKLSPKTQLLLATPEQAIRQRIGQDYVYHTIAGKTYLSGLIKMNTIQTPAAFKALGVNVGTKAGNIWTVQIPMENIKAFTQLNMIDYIELDEPISMNLDSVVRTTRADSVHAGINIVMPFTGKDVVVGVVDIGFDYTHPTLYDSLGNTYRVKRVWEQRKSGTPPTAYGYGTKLSTAFPCLPLKPITAPIHMVCTLWESLQEADEKVMPPAITNFKAWPLRAILYLLELHLTLRNGKTQAYRALWMG
jgi:minor extracellular serine protease Vpr